MLHHLGNLLSQAFSPLFRATKPDADAPEAQPPPPVLTILEVDQAGATEPPSYRGDVFTHASFVPDVPAKIHWTWKWSKDPTDRWIPSDLIPMCPDCGNHLRITGGLGTTLDCDHCGNLYVCTDKPFALITNATFQAKITSQVRDLAATVRNA